MVAHHIIATVQHIRHLGVTAKTLSGRGRHYETAIRIRLYNCGNPAEMLCIRQGRAAKFYNLNSHTHQILSLLCSGVSAVERELKKIKKVTNTKYYMKEFDVCQDPTVKKCKKSTFSTIFAPSFHQK
jgi:hypothetical protein